MSAAEPPQWDGSARAALAAYLASEGGRKFQALVAFYEQAHNRSVVLEATCPEHRRGYAAGFHAFGAWVQKLSSNVPTHPDDDNEPRTGAPGLVERYAP